MLSFDADGTAIITPFDSDGGKPTPATTVKGRWSGDEAGLAVRLSLKGAAPVFYVLSLPAGEEHCLLVTGPQARADLRAAWFGFPASDDDSGDDADGNYTGRP